MLWSPEAAATESYLKILKPMGPRAHTYQQERPLQLEAHALQVESSLQLLQLEKSP